MLWLKIALGYCVLTALGLWIGYRSRRTWPSQEGWPSQEREDLVNELLRPPH